MSNSNDDKPTVSVPMRLAPAVSGILAEQNALTPIVLQNETPSSEQLNEMLASGGGNLSTPQAEATVKRIPQVMKELFALAHPVKIKGLGTFSLKAKGKYDSDGRLFEGTKLQFKLGFRPSKSFRQFLETLTGTVVEATVKAPKVKSVTDALSDSINSVVTPGGMIKVVGTDMKFKALMSDEGAFFRESGDASGKAFKVMRYLDNKDARLTCEVPELEPGSYILEIRKRYKGCKTLRVGRFQTLLTVE